MIDHVQAIELKEALERSKSESEMVETARRFHVGLEREDRERIRERQRDRERDRKTEKD